MELRDGRPVEVRCQTQHFAMGWDELRLEAEVGGELAGGFRLATTGRIKFLPVRPDCAGQGLVEALVGLVLELADVMGIERLQVGPRHRAFTEALAAAGFRPHGLDMLLSRSLDHHFKKIL